MQLCRGNLFHCISFGMVHIFIHNLRLFRRYLSRLCQGSKEPCGWFQGAWLTPNEFQFISVRETEKVYVIEVHEAAADQGHWDATNEEWNRGDTRPSF